MPLPSPLDARPAAPPLTRRFRWDGFGGDCLLLLLLAGIAVGLGLGGNPLRAHPLPLVYDSKADRLQQSVSHFDASPVSPLHTPPERIDLARFHDLQTTKQAIILDARPPLFFRAGHVPGAKPLARESFEPDYDRQRAFLESHRQASLVVYCSGGECVDSRLVAAALQKLGYAHVLIFEGGWEEWQQAGLPEERG